MALTLEEVEHIAELAKLHLTDDEKRLYAGQCSAILDYAASLQRIDTGGVPPMTGATPLDTVLRDDIVEACLPPDQLLANAPDADHNMFRVNAILD